MIRPHTEASRNIGDFSADGRSIILHQPNEFALFLHLWHPLGCLTCGGCYFRNGRRVSNTVCDVAAEFPAGSGCQGAVCPAYNTLCLSICIYPSRRLSAWGSNHIPCASHSPGIEAQFGFFVIFKNQICLGTKFEQQLFLFYVLFKGV